jgi:hypothetical protein
MFWSQPAAEHVLALRCIHSSRRLDAFWKDRLNSHAARNDSLALAAYKKYVLRPSDLIWRTIASTTLSSSVACTFL